MPLIIGYFTRTIRVIRVEQDGNKLHYDVHSGAPGSVRPLSAFETFRHKPRPSPQKAGRSLPRDSPHTLNRALSLLCVADVFAISNNHLLLLAEPYGASLRVELTRGNHIRAVFIVGPTTIAVVIPNTPSDWRSERENTVAICRRKLRTVMVPA